MTAKFTGVSPAFDLTLKLPPYCNNAERQSEKPSMAGLCRGVNPSSSAISMLAPALSKRRTLLTAPFRVASDNPVVPYRPLESIWCLYFKRTSREARLLYNAA